MKVGPKEQQTRQLREQRAKKGRGKTMTTTTNEAAAAPLADLKEEPKVRTRKTKSTTKAPSRKAVKGTTKAKGDKTPRPGSKLEIVAKLLRRDKGCTTADVLAATKWPSVSMPQQAKALGVNLRKEKDGGVTRYHAA